MKNKYKIIIFLLLCLFSAAYWKSTFQNQKLAYKEISIADGQKNFVATYDTINYIVVADSEDARKDADKDIPVNIAMTIRDLDNNIIAVCNANMQIHVNGYTNTEKANFSSVPLHLQKGKNYQISYQAKADDGRNMTHLSFLLYGPTVHTDFDSIALFLIILLIFFLAEGFFSKNSIKYVGIWLILIFLTIIIMPTLQAKDERQAFADAYGYSNILMDKEACDENNNVYIEYNGIRDSGYMSYSVPLYRFWKDWNFGNQISEHRTSSLYQMSGNGFKAVMGPEILTITLARMFHFPYQIVLLAGWLANIGLVGSIMIIILNVIGGTLECRRFIFYIFMFPAVMLASLSYTGCGVIIALCGLFWAICKRMEYSEYSLKLEITSIVLLLFIILQNYAYAVLIIILVHVLRLRRENNKWSNKKEIVLVSIVSVETILLFISNILKTLDLGVNSFTDMSFYILKSLFVGTDRLMTEMVSYHYFGRENIIIASFSILIFLLLEKMQIKKHMIGREQNARVDYASILAWIVGTVLLACSNLNALEDSIQTSTFITGEQLIPLLFLPTVYEQNVIYFKREKIINITFLGMICLIVINRMGNL